MRLTDITTGDVAAWRAQLGSSSSAAAERDLMLAHLAMLIASHPFLGSELALRGGFALHHLMLPRPMRCCVSLEYARCSASPIGPVLDALRTLAVSTGCRVRTEVRDRPRVYLSLTTDEKLSDARLRIDLETRETRPLQPLVWRRLTILTRQVEVLTYQTEDLLGFVLRELYRRSSSRDLFDLWIGLTQLDVDDAIILAAFEHACAIAGLDTVDRAAFVARLHRHLERRAFTRDLMGLPGPRAGFEPATAAAVVTARLLDRLPRGGLRP